MPTQTVPHTSVKETPDTDSQCENINVKVQSQLGVQTQDDKESVETKPLEVTDAVVSGEIYQSVPWLKSTCEVILLFERSIIFQEWTV
jgi:hypothetical protein